MASLLLISVAAHAQNSGGGWIAQPTNQLGPYPYPYGADNPPYDWTGFTIFSTLVSNNGTTYSGSSTYYSGFGGHGGFVGGSYNQQATTSSGGASTYEWLWTPTGKNVGAPPPPLYVLTKAWALASLSPITGDKSGLSGSGTLTYPQTTVLDYTFGTGVQVIQYKILPASGSPNVSVSIGPVIKHSYSGTLTGGTGTITENLGISGSPIVVSAPNPMNRPDLGDGTNQYVYGAEQPNEQLTVPASVYVPNASTEGTTFLLSHVALSVSPVMQTGAQNFVFTASGPNMLVNTTTARPGYTSPWPSGQFCYIGLPPDNTYFGNHTMTTLVDGSASETAKYQLFFTGTASNWPNSDGTTPNWYEYYQQVYSSTKFYGAFDANLKSPYAGYCTGAAIHSQSSPDQYDVTNVGTYLGSDAINVPVIPVFALRKGAGSLQETTLIGELHVSGIHSYLRTYFEEIAHAETFVNHTCLPPDLSGYSPFVLDTDGDGVPDSLERKFGLDPVDPDTTGYYDHYAKLGYSGDNEVLAAILALKYLLQNKNLWQQDWADSGLQHGARPPYPCAASRSIFPWFYRSIENPNLPDSPDIPADALTDVPNLSN